MSVLRLWVVVLGGMLLAAAGVVEVDEPSMETRPAPVAFVRPLPIAETDVPESRGHRWSEGQVRGAVGDHLALLGEDQALVGAVAWRPPSHPHVDSYEGPPAVAQWAGGAWLVETGAGQWWVIEAHGRVRPADALARQYEVQLGCVEGDCP